MRAIVWLAVVPILGFAGCRSRRPGTLHIATTTTVEASGLLDRLVPAFEKASGIRLHAVVAGTGQALALLSRGDVEAALTHDPEGERALVERGVARRVEVMRNEFLLVGPAADPAGIHGRPVDDAMRAIAASGQPFVSRGDESGTHRAEKRLWKGAGVDPPRAPAYRETGQGAAQTLLVANERRAYTLVDNGTFGALGARVDLVPLVRGDPRMQNHYAVLWRSASGERFARFLQSGEARALMPPAFEPAAER